MDFLFDFQIWVSLITLTVLEVILGIDNIVIISILSGKLPIELQKKARKLGISLALVMRLLLLLSLAFLSRLTTPLFSIMNHQVTVRNLILLLGGLFLLVKSTNEIHETIKPKISADKEYKIKAKIGSVILQIVFMDLIFSFDSVITAVGMAQKIEIMVIAVILGAILMLLSTEITSKIINKYPSIKMLALSFILVVGFVLIIEGTGLYIPKSYIYFAMGFAGLVETLNILADSRNQKN